MTRSGRERWLTNRNQHAYASTNLGRAPLARAASLRGCLPDALALTHRAGSLPSEDTAALRGTGCGLEHVEPRQRGAERRRDLAPRARDSRTRGARARCLRALPRLALTLANASRKGRSGRWRVTRLFGVIRGGSTCGADRWHVPDRRACRLTLRLKRVGASRPVCWPDQEGPCIHRTEHEPVGWS